jgi:two-component system, sensor histidine kinase PdtaS
MINLFTDFSLKRNHIAFGHIFGLVAFFVAFGLRFLVEGMLPPGFPFLTFFPAVILTTYLVGLWPGIMTAVLSGLAAWYFFIAPTYSFVLNGGGTLALGFYAFIVSVDIAVIHIMNQALKQLASERNRSAELTRQTQTMFSELQHRVSNNLQLVSALMLLQEGKIEDPAALEVLADARNRLSTLGRLHRKLYDSSRNTIEIGSFLRDLCHDILIASGAEAIECRVTAANIAIPPEKLIPLALIVTELVSNSLEHGFAERRCGTISIDLSTDEGESGREYILTVQDDGAGLPAGFDLDHTDSLGLQIVKSLASQLSGRFSMAGGQGTQCRLILPA